MTRGTLDTWTESLLSISDLRLPFGEIQPGFYFMKKTIDAEFSSATVESKPGYISEGGAEIDEAVELIKYALLAVGFHPKTINQAFNETNN